MSTEWLTVENVACVACPRCAFTFDAAHTDADGSHSCPSCREASLLLKLAEARAALSASEAREAQYRSAHTEALRKAYDAGWTERNYCDKEGWDLRFHQAEAREFYIERALSAADGAGESDGWRERAERAEAALATERERTKSFNMLRIIAEKAAKEDCGRFYEGDCNSWRDPRRCAPCEARALLAAPASAHTDTGRAEG